MSSRTEKMSKDDDDNLSSHTLSMRKALDYCREMIYLWETSLVADAEEAVVTDLAASASSSSVTSSTTVSFMDLQEAASLETAVSSGIRREEGESGSATFQEEAAVIQFIDVLDSSSSLSSTTTEASTLFATFLQHNRPCLLRSAGVTQYFKGANAAWVTTSVENGDASSSSNTSSTAMTINRDWFIATIGADTIVPVRQSSVDHTDSAADATNAVVALDEQGRAAECETVKMPLGEYIAWLDDNGTSSTRQVGELSTLYLKDWHLQAWLEENCTVSPERRLYDVPPFFPHDLLNAFLQWTNGGDYCFVYWGASGSSTALHSDVLNSYSWSYNVCGVKEWTFYIPNNQGDGPGQCESRSTDTVVVRQETGDLMFVPSQWQHSVVNLCETLSINHNWVTTDNLHCVWDCIATELLDVNAELESSWNIACMEARENMLRGCIGLNVTAFFFMVLTRGLEQLREVGGHAKTAATASIPKWQSAVSDLVRIRDAINVLIVDEHETIQLSARLQATLVDPSLGDEAIEIATIFMKSVQENLPRWQA